MVTGALNIEIEIVNLLKLSRRLLRIAKAEFKLTLVNVFMSVAITNGVSREEIERVIEKAHDAGYDAFMTMYCGTSLLCTLCGILSPDHDSKYYKDKFLPNVAKVDPKELGQPSKKRKRPQTHGD